MSVSVSKLALRPLFAGLSHREALTKGLEDFQRMLTEVRQSNGVLTEQLKQFEVRVPRRCQRTERDAIACQGSLDDVRATNEHLGRQLTDFGDRLQLVRQIPANQFTRAVQLAGGATSQTLCGVAGEEGGGRNRI